MHLSLTDEQRFLLEAADHALSRHRTLEAARAGLDGAPPLDLWPLAAGAGWTGLLTGEDAGGAGLSAYDALLVLERCGGRLADARLLGHLPATALLEADGGHGDLRAALAAGDHRAALLDATCADRALAVDVQGEGDQAMLTGTLTGVLDAAGADALVVVARGPLAAVVAADADGVVIEPGRAYDATRSVATVILDGAPGVLLDLSPERARDGADLQRLLLAAESVGSADACLTLARDHALARVAFGRPIGSYQAIKHKLVEMLRRTEGARSLLVGAGRAWDADRPAFALLANAARVAGADALGYAAAESIFIHGGIGATWEHDASLYYRRAELARRLAGGTDRAADEVAAQLLDAAVAA